MNNAKNPTVIADTSVIINFLKLNKVKLLAQYSDEFYVTDHVFEEVLECYPDQYNILNKAISFKFIRKRVLNDINELKLFAELKNSGRIGYGECSAIAYALHNSCVLAIDDNIAIKQAHSFSKDLKIIGTQGIMTALIKRKVLTVKEANAIKSEWESKHRFKLKLNCFSETL